MPSRLPRITPYFSIASIVYAEHVGIKRQLGGKRGEMKYRYPRTHPMNTVLRKSLTIMSCVVGSVTAGNEGTYRHVDVPGVQKPEVGANGQNDIRSRRILFWPESEGLPDDSFEAISLHCATNLSVNADPQPVPACGIVPADEGEAFTVQTSSAAVDGIELPPLAQQSILGQTLTCQWLGRKSLPAFRPSCRQYRPAPAGLHSFTKAVDMFAFEIAWLKRSLAHSLLPHLRNPWESPMSF